MKCAMTTNSFLLFDCMFVDCSSLKVHDKMLAKLKADDGEYRIREAIGHMMILIKEFYLTDAMIKSYKLTAMVHEVHVSAGEMIYFEPMTLYQSMSEYHGRSSFIQSNIRSAAWKFLSGPQAIIQHVAHRRIFNLSDYTALMDLGRDDMISQQLPRSMIFLLNHLPLPMASDHPFNISYGEFDDYADATCDVAESMMQDPDLEASNDDEYDKKNDDEVNNIESLVRSYVSDNR